MPKISKDRKVIAKQEPLGIYECILLRPSHEYKHVPRFPRKRVNAAPVRVIPRPFDPERARQADEDIAQLAERARLLKEIRRLERISQASPPLIDRISDPSRPLIERLQAPVQIPEYKPVPKDLHMLKHKVVDRIREFECLFRPTVERLSPFVKKALEDDRISKDAKDDIRLWGTKFNELYTNLEKRARKLTNKEWRIIKRQLKAVGQVSFKNLNERL
ncbi:hypothetical protein OH76DRAFT_1522273, partial [Lentinus brumalis]